jgi:hypothetical protein
MHLHNGIVASRWLEEKIPLWLLYWLYFAYGCDLMHNLELCIVLCCDVKCQRLFNDSLSGCCHELNKKPKLQYACNKLIIHLSRWLVCACLARLLISEKVIICKYIYHSNVNGCSTFIRKVYLHTGWTNKKKSRSWPWIMLEI